MSPMSLHVYVPFVTNFKFFIFGFFPEPKMNVGDAQKRIPVVVKSKMTKVTRVEIFFHRLGSFFRSPHHMTLTVFSQMSDHFLLAPNSCYHPEMSP